MVAIVESSRRDSPVGPTSTSLVDEQEFDRSIFRRRVARHRSAGNLRQNVDQSFPSRYSPESVRRSSVSRLGHLFDRFGTESQLPTGSRPMFGRQNDATSIPRAESIDQFDDRLVHTIDGQLSTSE